MWTEVEGVVATRGEQDSGAHLRRPHTFSQVRCGQVRMKPVDQIEEHCGGVGQHVVSPQRRGWAWALKFSGLPPSRASRRPTGPRANYTTAPLVTFRRRPPAGSRRTIIAAGRRTAWAGCPACSGPCRGPRSSSSCRRRACAHSRPLDSADATVSSAVACTPEVRGSCRRGRRPPATAWRPVR